MDVTRHRDQVKDQRHDDHRRDRDPERLPHRRQSPTAASQRQAPPEEDQRRRADHDGHVERVDREERRRHQRHEHQVGPALVLEHLVDQQPERHQQPVGDDRRLEAVKPQLEEQRATEQAPGERGDGGPRPGVIADRHEAAEPSHQQEHRQERGERVDGTESQQRVDIGVQWRGVEVGAELGEERPRVLGEVPAAHPRPRDGFPAILGRVQRHGARGVLDGDVVVDVGEVERPRPHRVVVVQGGVQWTGHGDADQDQGGEVAERQPRSPAVATASRPCADHRRRQRGQRQRDEDPVRVVGGSELEQRGGHARAQAEAERRGEPDPSGCIEPA